MTQKHGGSETGAVLSTENQRDGGKGAGLLAGNRTGSGKGADLMGGHQTGSGKGADLMPGKQGGNGTADDWRGSLVAAMHLRRVSQKRLAEELGVTANYVCMVLSGRRCPGGAEERFRRALGAILASREHGSKV